MHVDWFKDVNLVVNMICMNFINHEFSIGNTVNYVRGMTE